ncbi:MAG: polysaccharide deacetylase family protein [Novosphingobium sp.]
MDRAPPPGRGVGFAPGFGQRFLLTVDTEEEFDWSQPLQREGHGLVSVPRLRKFQQFCEAAGVVPVYLVDYPIVSSPAAVEALGEAVAAGLAEIGIQLHPWVNPPHEEEITQANSFAGNLPEALERAKLLHLRDAIERAFGTVPAIYRAGRYGVGPNTARLLSAAGVAIDSSVRSRFDYSYNGGADFREHPLEPYWLDRAGGLMELPLTTVFWGPLRNVGPWLYPRLWRAPRLRGALSRLGLLERIPLTPEGVTAEEAIRAIDIAIDEELPVLVFSFHSPSLAPGHTPYVRSEEQLDAFYEWWRVAFAYLAQRGVRPTSVAEIMAAVALD